MKKLELPLAMTVPDAKSGYIPLEVVEMALGLKTEAAKEFLKITLENVLLMDKKQLDYGPHNIRKGGVFGCLLRASDKFERLFNLHNTKSRKAINESIEDSYRDISNYMIIAIMLEHGKWPTV